VRDDLRSGQVLSARAVFLNTVRLLQDDEQNKGLQHQVVFRMLNAVPTARPNPDTRQAVGNGPMRRSYLREAILIQFAERHAARISRIFRISIAASGAALLALSSGVDRRSSHAEGGVDTALIVSVDVSQSVDADRYKLQMEGIAQAIEDPGVVASITGGDQGAILFSMVTWADQAYFAVDWQRIASQADAARVAALVRGLPQKGGEFTCLGRMMHTVATSIVPHIPVPASRVVVDVSGDGIDNCSDKSEVNAERDAILQTGATINGLPVIVAGENDIVGTGAYRAPGYGLRELSRESDQDGTTLEQWFKDHVVGGPSAFVLTAQGYSDFGRAFRRKFVTEISALTQPIRPHQ
jgi:Protein of unknown function (DUF1194)